MGSRMSVKSNTRTTLALAAALALLAEPAGAACDCTTLPSLGAAAEFPGLGLSGTRVELIGSVFAESTFQGPATDGNIGGSGNEVELQGAANIAGYIHYHAGTLVTPTSEANAAGGAFEVDMSTVNADAIQASADLAAMTATQTFGAITTSTTITGGGCINVIEMDYININGGNKTVTFKGTSDDYFVVNVTSHSGNKAVFVGGNAKLVLDGMRPHQVIFNIAGPVAGRVVDMQGGGAADGTFLNPTGNVLVQGNAGGRGAYMAGGTLLHFQGNADFYGESFQCGVTPLCPDPEATGVNIQTPATPTSRSTGNTPFYHAYYDTTSYEGHLESFRVTPDANLKDKLNADAIDPVTKLLKATRTPYWDAGVLLRSDTVRKIYTTLSGARADFNTTNVSVADLDLTAGEIPSYPNYSEPSVDIDDTTELRDAVVAYVHGKDAFDEDLDGTTTTEMRSAVLGDIFHSNALFIGSPTTLLAHEDGYDGFLSAHDQRDRVVYAGANDALLHAFDGGAYWDPTDPTAFNAGTGEELFGYLPGQLLPVAKQTPKTIDQTGARLIPGFVDGNTVAADAWLGDGSGTDITKTASEWATVLISAYREGGKGYLALDVTNPAANAAPHGPYPKLLWEFTNAKMGQSWSRPVITRVKVKGASSTGDHCGADDGEGDCREQWVAIFGGGHEHDSDPNDAYYFGDHTHANWSNRSKAIFIVALDTGALLDVVSFDATVGSGTETMKYGIPSAPAVLDLNHDGFGDVVYIGDTAGQLWKWDISNVGEDTAGADGIIDNWKSAVFFSTASVVLGTGDTHYKSIYAPAAATYVNGVLTLAFGTGERRDTRYAGDVLKDDNNRLYVVRDLTPTGFSLPLTAVTEADLTDVTSTGVYVDPGNLGYYVVAEEGEKFFTDVTMFAGYVIAASYKGPDAYPTCGPGSAFLYAYAVDSGKGFFDTDSNPDAGDRRLLIGSGIPSSPRVTVASDPDDDIIFVTSSEGQVLLIEPPARPGPESDTIYWRQLF